MHKKNVHANGYDFPALLKSCPKLAPFIKKNAYNQKDTIDFSHDMAVKALNMALLNHHYHIDFWDIPQGYLCPAIPGRVDYIHHLADLLRFTDTAQYPNQVSVLDIGTGASCIYPILGAKSYGWNFTATDIDPVSIDAAKLNVKANQGLEQKINCRLQQHSSHVFKGIIQENEFYHLTLCNPPFHKSLADATQGTTRKLKNLAKGKQANSAIERDKSQSSKLNFGGQKAELWCEGGELAFIRNMIKESRYFQDQVLWFTCLVSKKDNLSAIKLSLKKAKASQIKTVKMAQGQKISRFVAWSFQHP